MLYHVPTWPLTCITFQAICDIRKAPKSFHLMIYKEKYRGAELCGIQFEPHLRLAPSVPKWITCHIVRECEEQEFSCLSLPWWVMQFPSMLLNLEPEWVKKKGRVWRSPAVWPPCASWHGLAPLRRWWRWVDGFNLSILLRLILESSVL